MLERTPRRHGKPVKLLPPHPPSESPTAPLPSSAFTATKEPRRFVGRKRARPGAADEPEVLGSPTVPQNRGANAALASATRFAASIAPFVLYLPRASSCHHAALVAWSYPGRVLYFAYQVAFRT